MNQMADKNTEKISKNTSKVIKKEDKHTRAFSQKDAVAQIPNESSKGRSQKNRSFKRNT